MPHSRLGCSTISFRHLPLDEALAQIAELGFTTIDLGALPGVCDHVPYVLDAGGGRRRRRHRRPPPGCGCARSTATSATSTRPLDAAGRADRDRHLEALLTLAAATGARALVLPCGALDHNPLRSLDDDLDLVAAELIAAAAQAHDHGVELWTESLHYFRLCRDIERAQALTDRLAGTDVGMVMDFSHIVASGGDPLEFVDRFADRIAHVHIRDAEPGNINLSVGHGSVDFAAGLKALADAGYAGHFSLELETRDITHDQRPAGHRPSRTTDFQPHLT